MESLQTGCKKLWYTRPKNPILIIEAPILQALNVRMLLRRDTAFLKIELVLQTTSSIYTGA